MYNNSSIYAHQGRFSWVLNLLEIPNVSDVPTKHKIVDTVSIISLSNLKACNNIEQCLVYDLVANSTVIARSNSSHCDRNHAQKVIT